MSTIRQQKVAKLIQKEISDIFTHDKRGFLHGAMLSVIEVEISPDLYVAKIFISMLLQKEPHAILTTLNQHKHEIRKALGQKIRHQVRVIPELVFVHDETETNAQRIDALIDSLHIPKATDD